MQRFMLAVGVTALMVASSNAQAQTQNDMTIPEFRQVLLDLGSYLDAHKGTSLHSQFEAVPDDILQQVYSAVPNGRQLQSAVAALKQHDARQMQKANASMATIVPNVAFPACTPGSIIDNSPGAQCTPAYPDPTNGGWRTMVNPLITAGAFSPTDYADVSSQACGLTEETTLQQLTAVLQGTVLAASAVCGAIPAPGGNICWGVNAAFSIASAVSFGLFSDCVEQDGLVNAAEIDAGFHNTVTIYNDLNTSVAGLNTHLTNVNNQITGEFSALDTHLSNVDNHITTEFGTLTAELVSLFNQLTNQITQSTALSDAELRQVMKLLLTPDGRKEINAAILTCTGTNCPNVLAACPKAGCSWNNAGPLP